jgi:hypothetical protein
MTRLNSKWFDVLVGGAFGVAAVWHVRSVLVAGKWEFWGLFGNYFVTSPDKEPFYYWLWVGIWTGIALFCFLQVVRAVIDIIHVNRMNRHGDQE